MTDNAFAGEVVKPDIAKRLRDETLSAHRQIEAVMSDLLFAVHFDLVAYQKVLERHRAYYEQVEGKLSQFTSTASMMKQRSKISWLNSDISYLNNHEMFASIEEEPLDGVVVKLPRNEAQAWGFLYVSEGATLGGGHILNRLRHQRCFTSDSGLRFFQSYGRNTPAMWREFQLSLQSFAAANPGCEEQIINGANMSFSNMYDLMRGVHLV